MRTWRRPIDFDSDYEGGGDIVWSSFSRRTAIVFLVGLCLGRASSAQRYDPNTVIVTYRDRPSIATLNVRARNHATKVTERFSAIEERLGRSMAVLNVQGRPVEEVAAELRQDPTVQSVDLNYYCKPFASVPDDTLFPQQWALLNTGQTVNGVAGTSGADIRWMEAMRLAPPTGEVVVAVLDSGVDYTHPELAPNMWINTAEIPGNGIDDDTNAVIDDVYGFDRAGSTTNYIYDGDPMPDGDTHGTFVAGIIAAQRNNAFGTAGANPRVRIMALKNSSIGTFPISLSIGCINYAIIMKSRGANVVAINASFGTPDDIVAFQNAIISAGQWGIITCAAAGNSSVNNDVTPVYPAAYTDNCILAVAASDPSDQLASFSNYGSNSVDLAAPGTNIWSTDPVGLSVDTSLSTAYTNYNPYPLAYGGLTTGITASVMDCGLGFPTSFPPAVAGNIALIQRGALAFYQKVSNAMVAGAAAAIIYNNTNGNFSSSLAYPSNWIPAVSLSMEEGLDFLAHLPVTATLSVVATNAFGLSYGTSFAAPFVSAAVAMMAVAYPGDSVTQRIARILAHVHPVAALQGKVLTGGRLDLAAPLDTDNDALGDWWELQYTNGLAGLTGNVDSDGDGVKNADEFVAGTHPLSATSSLHFVSAQKVSGTQLSFQWPSAPGKRYRVQRANSAAGAWTNVSPFLPATPVANVYTAATGAASGTWRIEVE